eukprot:6206384-Pleurochrysis_carterae.AAC.6
MARVDERFRRPSLHADTLFEVLRLMLIIFPLLPSQFISQNLRRRLCGGTCTLSCACTCSKFGAGPDEAPGLGATQLGHGHRRTTTLPQSRTEPPAVGELIFVALDEFESEFSVGVGRVVEDAAATARAIDVKNTEPTQADYSWPANPALKAHMRVARQLNSSTHRLTDVLPVTENTYTG